MKIGVISDSHDNVAMIEKVLDVFNSQEVTAVLHAGDIIAPFSAKALDKFKGRVIAVYGNCDGERVGLKHALPEIEEGPISFDLAGKKFVMAHDPARLGDISGADYAVHGHTHVPRDDIRAGVRVLNPGELGGHLSGKGSAIILDTSTGEVVFVEVEA